jgi:hypothetical protein
VPYTILESNSSSNTLRQYLDAGGSLLWIGDVPLYYKGEMDKEEPTNVAKFAAPIEILGIIPIYSVPKTTVSFTFLGRKVGLRTKWSGMRPVIQDGGIVPLANSESLACRYFAEITRKTSAFGRFQSKLSTIQSVQTMQFGLTFGEKTDQNQDRSKPTIHAHEVHTNAWVKCFNTYYSKSGFYRIWDYPPANLTDEMVNELVEIAQAISRRIANTSEIFWMPRAR